MYASGSKLKIQSCFDSFGKWQHHCQRSRVDDADMGTLQTHEVEGGGIRCQSWDFEGRAIRFFIAKRRGTQTGGKTTGDRDGSDSDDNNEDSAAWVDYGSGMTRKESN